MHTPPKSVLNLSRSTEMYRPVNVSHVFHPEILKRIHSKTGNGFLPRNAVPSRFDSLADFPFRIENSLPAF